jgi:DNA-binding XRE family transcriptional regulator
MGAKTREEVSRDLAIRSINMVFFNLRNNRSYPERSMAAWLWCQRRALGLKQKDLADSIGVDQSILSKIEHGTRRMDAHTMTLLIPILGEFKADEWEDFS